MDSTDIRVDLEARLDPVSNHAIINILDIVMPYQEPGQWVVCLLCGQLGVLWDSWVLVRWKFEGRHQIQKFTPTLTEQPVQTKPKRQRLVKSKPPAPTSQTPSRTPLASWSVDHEFKTIRILNNIPDGAFCCRLHNIYYLISF